MSLIPFIMDLADELQEINRGLFAGSGMDVDDFGFGIYLNEQQQQSQQQRLQSQELMRRPRSLSQLLWLPSAKQRNHPYQRSSKTACCGQSANNTQVQESEKNAASKLACPLGNNKNGFQVSMNVKQFAPEELSVKTVENCIVVEGRHEEKEDGHGVISRHFVRKYMLPKGYEPNAVLSTLSSDGILTVKAPHPPTANADEIVERIVDIQQTGPAQLSAKESLSKEQPKTVVAIVEAVPQQQQQQLDMQPQMSERNGDYNSNEIEKETVVATEKKLVPPNAVTGTTTSSMNAEDKANGIAPVISLTIPADNTVIGLENISSIPVNKAVAESDIAAALLDGVDGVSVVLAEAGAENLVLVAQPTAGDLVAAADAAILLAKAQYENVSSKTATEEVAN